MTKETGWGNVAGEYKDSFIDKEGSYHATVILPNLLRIVDPKPGVKILEVGCGDGYFTSAFAEKGAEVVGSDIAREMIEHAKKREPKLQWHAAPADKLDFAQDASLDTVVVVLALQNIENLNGALSEASRVLKPGGSLVFVLNHPVFRIPKKSSWGFDEATNTQYRRLDAYLSESIEEIDMDPGKESGKRITVSFHRPLQLYIKVLAKHGFGVVGFEEWISNKKSQSGPRQKAEDIARKEFPLFLMVKAQKLA
ncbi:MAG: class I SAM-dependent methyltransferase [Patescibacteria group bacterium]